MVKGFEAHILLVEDTVSIADVFATQLQNAGFSVDTVHLGEEARERLAVGDYHVVLLDLQLPDLDGLQLLEEVGEDVLVIVVTADASADRVVTAMRMGAHDYLVKPVAPDRLVLTVRNALQLIELREEVRSRQERTSFCGFLGAAKPMQAIYDAIENVAQSKATVFITGESGTGKEVCADALHRSGPRRDGPFIALNCGAIPSELIESEIFGHVKGAFTGAVADRAGAATLAHGGTLFLDEICEMEVSLQTKLLRFLQTTRIQRVGSQKTEEVDVRVVCATNRDPLEEMRAGRFREDLYYRLNVIPIRLPPLRERDLDVVLIANEFLSRFAEEERKQFRRFAPEVERILRRYPWPGNVRELQNVVRRVVVMNDAEVVEPYMLPSTLISHENPPAAEQTAPEQALVSASGLPNGADLPAVASPEPSLAEMEREIIEARIRVHGGNVAEAAASLGVSPSTLYRKRAGWRATS